VHQQRLQMFVVVHKDQLQLMNRLPLLPPAKLDTACVQTCYLNWCDRLNPLNM